MLFRSSAYMPVRWTSIRCLSLVCQQVSSVPTTSTACGHMSSIPRYSTDTFLNEFAEITGFVPIMTPNYRRRLDRLVSFLVDRDVLPIETRRRAFIAGANRKFLFNSDQLNRFYRVAAGAEVTFHYHEKREIELAFNLRDSSRLSLVLVRKQLPSSVQSRLMTLFAPVDEATTIRQVANERRRPSKLRKSRVGRTVDAEIGMSLFSAFMWESVPHRVMHEFFDPHFSVDDYVTTFWQQLRQREPRLFLRSSALHIVRVTPDVMDGRLVDVNSFALDHTIAKLYDVVDNYGFVALVIERLQGVASSDEWRLAAESILFAEKHRELSLDNSYFRWRRVERDTLSHVAALDANGARFNLINEGFTYRDTYVLSSGGALSRLVIVFQKNDRDETVIPCPACRSYDVRGNSYSTLGVKSWECMNLLCPGRSKYNRGKRYSLRSLLMQQSISDARNEVPVESVRRWRRDVVNDPGDRDLIEMLVRHYSMSDDGIHIHNWDTIGGVIAERNVEHHPLKLAGKRHRFWDGAFFRRYLVDSHKAPFQPENIGDDRFRVYVGDAARVLRGFPDAVFDGAVTSPPYYNAREYSQWPNIYCYLHDMYDINRQVLRTLKSSSLYLYNIFDYFDNEHSVVFSAMGQRRMLLSAYTIHMFRLIGFELLGVVVWDKGEIEGKRAYNGGNFAPFYQSPFNCWEHVIVSRKPDEDGSHQDCRDSVRWIDEILESKPVVKMIHGRNRHGHSAPFPDALPEILMSQMQSNALVVDPFAGSLTTGRVAQRYGIRSVCIDTSQEYCKLGIRLWQHDRESRKSSQLELF